MQCFAAFIVETNKRFLLFFIQQEILKTCRRENLGFCIRFFSKTSEKMQPNVFLVICRLHAKIQALLKKRVDFPLSIVFDQALQLADMLANCICPKYGVARHHSPSSSVVGASNRGVSCVRFLSVTRICFSSFLLVPRS